MSPEPLLPPALRQISSSVDERRLVFTAQSKRDFYCRDAVCEFVFRQGAVPLNPFRAFGYFLDDRVPRDDIRSANNNLIRIANELWIFADEIANGVLFEAVFARQLDMPIKFFNIAPTAEEIRPTPLSRVKFEKELRDCGLTVIELRQVLSGKWRSQRDSEQRLFDPDSPVVDEPTCQRVVVHSAFGA